MGTIFSLSNLFVLPFWFLMIVLPHWRWTGRVMQRPWMLAVPAFVYTILALSQLGTLAPVALSPSLPSVIKLFSVPGLATAGWVHFLAFDLAVGRWIYLTSREQGMSAWIIGPMLFLMLMLGPVGLLSYLLLRLFLVVRVRRSTLAAILWKTNRKMRKGVKNDVSVE